jgi:predicted DNA-binding protein
MADQVKTTVRIREDLFLKVKLLATARGESFANVINEAIEKYIQEHEDEIRKRVSDVL